MKKKLWLTALLAAGTLISPAAAAETEPSSPVGAVSVLSDDLGAAASAGVCAAPVLIRICCPPAM